VATTSTKPPPVIKADIKRVLDRMQVQYREIKGGFECIHLPSIDLSSVRPPSVRHGHQKRPSTGSNEAGHGGAARSLVKKASKMSFGKLREMGRDKEKERDGSTDTKELPSRPSVGTTLTATPSSGSSSFFNVSSNAHTVTAGDTPRLSDVNGAVPPSPGGDPSPQSTPSKPKFLPPIPRDMVATPQTREFTPLPTGEVDKEMFEMMGANTLSVRFEINIVKVSFVNFALWEYTYATEGSLVTTARDPVPESKWRRLAIPNASPTSAHGIKVITILFSSSPSHFRCRSRDIRIIPSYGRLDFRFDSLFCVGCFHPPSLCIAS
jgi:serine/threonine protein kinase KIN1/2